MVSASRTCLKADVVSKCGPALTVQVCVVADAPEVHLRHQRCIRRTCPRQSGRAFPRRGGRPSVRSMLRGVRSSKRFLGWVSQPRARRCRRIQRRPDRESRLHGDAGEAAEFVGLVGGERGVLGAAVLECAGGDDDVVDIAEGEAGGFEEADMLARGRPDSTRARLSWSWVER